MTITKSLKIEAAASDALDYIIDEVNVISEQEDWPQDLIFTTHLVLEELCLNVINHAYRGRPGIFEVVITSDVRALKLEIIDNGPEYNVLTDAPTPNVSAIIEDRPVGGLGVHLVKNLTDEMDYKREDNKNHLTVIKRRNA